MTFTPHPLYTWRKIPGTHWIGGWVGPRAGVNTAVVKRKNLIIVPAGDQTPVVKPVA
jgi:hypothetical protein